MITSLHNASSAILSGHDAAKVFAEYYANRTEAGLAQDSAHYRKGLTTWADRPKMLEIYRWHLAIIEAEQARRAQ